MVLFKKQPLQFPPVRLIHPSSTLWLLEPLRCGTSLILPSSLRRHIGRRHRRSAGHGFLLIKKKHGDFLNEFLFENLTHGLGEAVFFGQLEGSYFWKSFLFLGYWLYGFDGVSCYVIIQVINLKWIGKGIFSIPVYCKRYFCNLLFRIFQVVQIGFHSRR